MGPVDAALDPSAGRNDPVDEVDRRLIAVLRTDARISMTALAQRAHISRASCYARVERLERTGVITGYAAQVDHRKLGYGLTAHVYLKVRQHSWKTIRQVLRQIPEVESGALVSGENDLVLFVRTRDADSIRELVLDRLQAMDDVLATHTVLVFDEL